MILEPPIQRKPVSHRSPNAGVSSPLQRKCACGGTTGPTGECDACRKKRESGTLQRAPNHSSSLSSHPSEVPPIVHDVLRSPGQPLDPDTRAFMQSRFGHDFSRVRVHTDSQAAVSARAVKALAYAVGYDVVFGNGRYNPGAEDGRYLLAHELAHVVQQRHGMPMHGSLRIGKPDDFQEGEANAAARLTLAEPIGHPDLHAASVAPHVQRQTEHHAPTKGEEEEDGLEEEQENNPEVEGQENDESGASPEDHDEMSEERDPKETDPTQVRKPKLARWRRQIRVGDFVGPALSRLFNRSKPKYLHRPWSFSRKPKEEQYEWVKKVVGTKLVTVEKSDTGTFFPPFERDTQTSWHGNAFYTKGEPKTARTIRDPDERWLYAQPEDPKCPKGGKVLDRKTSTTVTGTLSYSFGDESDTLGVGGLGQVRVTSFDTAGKSTVVFDSGWVSTLGKTVTVTLNNAPANANYLVVIGRENWWAGSTEFMYDLQLTQITKTVIKCQVDIIRRIKVKKTKIEK